MEFLFAITAGAAMSVQGVMNTRLGEKIGVYESNMYVQGTAFLLSVIVMLIMGKGNLKEIEAVNKFYWFGGVFGLIITIMVMKAVGASNPTIAVSVILIAQLITAAIIDVFGLMDSEKIAFTWNKYIGVVLMLGGVMIFKWQK